MEFTLWMIFGLCLALGLFIMLGGIMSLSSKWSNRRYLIYIPNKGLIRFDKDTGEISYVKKPLFGTEFDNYGSLMLAVDLFERQQEERKSYV